MKKIIRSFPTTFAVLFALIAFISDHASAQRSIVFAKIIEANTLSRIENERGTNVLKEGFASNHWFAEISLDPHAEELEINLPETEPLHLILERRREQSSELISWRGRTMDGIGSATLVWHNGMITGMITVNPKLVYRIQPVSENRHIIYQLNQMNTPREESEDHYEKMKNRAWVPSEEMQAPDQENDENNPESRGSDCYIRILVGFDNVAGPSLADPIGFALECIELSNTIYSNSQVNFEVELAYADIYNDAASTDIDEALAEWQFELGDEKFETVHSDREQYDADFCILITESFDGTFVGLAATILASYSSAFCVVEDGAAIDNLSFPHEIGHLMGARHDLYVDGSGDYNHGYILHSEQVRTVMAYDDECDDNGYNCTRIQYFSNPDVDFPGTSKALGTSAEEHNERALDENESEFADFEPVVIDKAFLFPEFIDGTVYASVIALSTITHNANYEITDGATVVWSAGSSMVMKTGFLAESGSSFEAKTDGCNAARMEDAVVSSAPESPVAIVVYPNPAGNQTKISVETQKESSVHICLRDLAGRILNVVSETATVATGTHDYDVNLMGLSAAVYLVEISISGERSIQKLVVEK